MKINKVGKKPTVNKQIVKFEYENISSTDRELAKKHNVSAAYIGKLAKDNNWKKASKNIKPVMESNMPAGFVYDPGHKKNDLLASMTIDMAERMVNELHCYTPIIGQLERWIVEATEDDGSDRRRQVMLKAVSFSQRAKDLQTLANILVQTRGVVLSGHVAVEGKKAEAQARADAISKSSKFAPSAPPLRIAK